MKKYALFNLGGTASQRNTSGVPISLTSVVKTYGMI